MIIRKKCINNTKTVIWGSHRLIVQAASLLHCCVVWLGNLLPKFRRNLPPSLSGLWVKSGSQNTDTEGGTLSETNTEKQLPKHTAQQPSRPGSSTRNKFANNVFQLSVTSSISSLLHTRRGSMAVLSQYYLKWRCGEQTTLPTLSHTHKYIIQGQGMAGNTPHSKSFRKWLCITKSSSFQKKKMYSF